jgi:threonine/homoserine/homoserine lactone efflux protein
MKSLFSTLSLTVFYFATASLASAQNITPEDPCAGQTTFKEICRLGGAAGGTGNVLGTFISLFFVIAAIIAVIYLVYGGIKYITSRGDKTEVENARNQIIAAIVGLILVFLAFFLINFVLGFLIPGFNISNITIPTLTN